MSKLLLPGTVLLENDENYIKQTYRNRCYIAGPNGVQSLSIPVEKASFHKVHIRDVKIDWSVPWNALHLRALSAAYRSSPFYEYYIDDLKKIYQQKPLFLFDMNLRLLEQLTELLGIDCNISFTGTYYSPAPQDHLLDYRESIRPKKKKPDALYHPVEYHQVFDDRFGFLKDLSIADLLFNEGPDSRVLLRRCLPPSGSVRT